MFANSRENFYIFPPGAQCTIAQRQHTNASDTCKGDKRTYWWGETLLSYVLRAYGAFDTQYSMLQLYVNVFVTSHTVNMKPRQVRKHRSRGWVRRRFNTHTHTVAAESNVRTHPGKCLLCFKFKFEIHHSPSGPFDMQPLGHTLWVWWKWSPAVQKQPSFFEWFFFSLIL